MTEADHKIIISILTAAFEQNPRFQAVIKKNNPTRSVRHMTEYAYHLIDRLNGIYLSEDKTTVLFYYTRKQYNRVLSVRRFLTNLDVWINFQYSITIK